MFYFHPKLKKTMSAPVVYMVGGSTWKLWSRGGEPPPPESGKIRGNGRFKGKNLKPSGGGGVPGEILFRTLVCTQDCARSSWVGRLPPVLELLGSETCLCGVPGIWGEERRWGVSQPPKAARKTSCPKRAKLE